MGKISPSIISLITGLGIGLIKDDLGDLNKWFKFHKDQIMVNNNPQIG
jgi:hypothetical protein